MKVKTNFLHHNVLTIDGYEGVFVVFDELKQKTKKNMDSFVIGEISKFSFVYCLSEPCFVLPERTIRNNSIKLFSFKLTWKDVSMRWNRRFLQKMRSLVLYHLLQQKVKLSHNAYK